MSNLEQKENPGPSTNFANSPYIRYSKIYFDAKYEYQHVTLPKHMGTRVPKNHLMTEAEWRQFGVMLSSDWEIYLMHPPEPHVLLFRRPRKISPENPSN